MFDTLAPLLQRFGEWYRAGEVLYREGEVRPALYFVVSGQVEISVYVPEISKRRVLRGIGIGGMFGETSCFTGTPHSATATATQDTAVVRLPRESAVQITAQHPDLAIRVIQTLGDRVRSTTESITRAMLDGHAQVPGPAASRNDRMRPSAAA